MEVIVRIGAGHDTVGITVDGEEAVYDRAILSKSERRTLGHLVGNAWSKTHGLTRSTDQRAPGKGRGQRVRGNRRSR